MLTDLSKAGSEGYESVILKTEFPHSEFFIQLKHHLHDITSREHMTARSEDRPIAKDTLIWTATRGHQRRSRQAPGFKDRRRKALRKAFEHIPGRVRKGV